MKVLKKEYKYYNENKAMFIEKYSDNYITLVGEKVVACGKNFDTVFEITRAKGYKLGTFLIQHVTRTEFVYTSEYMVPRIPEPMLKPCPFCGSSPVVLNWEDSYRIQCYCKHESERIEVCLYGQFSNKEEIIKIWNTRTSTGNTDELKVDIEVLYEDKKELQELLKQAIKASKAWEARFNESQSEIQRLVNDYVVYIKKLENYDYIQKD